MSYDPVFDNRPHPADFVIATLRADNERLRAALTNAKEKLEIYWRARPSHEYTGGMEYSHLMHEIETALTTEQKASKT